MSSSTTTRTKTEVRNLKYEFTIEERDRISADLAREMRGLSDLESEFKQVKDEYKAKISEGEARINKLVTLVTNRFEMRDMELRVVYRQKEGEKDYYALDAAEGAKPILTEKMKGNDFQQELIEAESIFSHREEIQLFTPTAVDSGILVVGCLASNWFSALRINIGKTKVAERLDSEQRHYKQRSDAVADGVKRAGEWLKANLKDLAAGFDDQLNAVVQAHKERAE